MSQFVNEVVDLVGRGEAKKALDVIQASRSSSDLQALKKRLELMNPRPHALLEAIDRRLRYLDRDNDFGM